jgi:hypothetical protein
MGLDARVFCNCYEKGVIRQPPPQPELVSVDESGDIFINTDNPEADFLACDTWREHACEHDQGQLVSHRIGNIALVAVLRTALSRSAQSFPVMLSKVVYDGTHCGDFLSLKQVHALEHELPSLTEYHSVDPKEEKIIRHFESQMRDLVAASLAVGKPIVF